MKKLIGRTANTLLIIIAVLSLVFLAAFSIYIGVYSDYRIEEEELAYSQSTITQLYTMDFSDRVGRVGMPAEEPYEKLYSTRRIWTPYDQFPKELIQAFVAIEDHRFFEHSGVDLMRTGKAALNCLFHFEDRTFGASTITQQLVKNVTGNNQVKIKRKINEIFSAWDLEKRFSKEEIMELYLNVIYLSENSYGIGAASELYFAKHPSELTLVECAALAAIVQNPYRFDPYLFPEENQARREVVLSEMLRYGMIDHVTYTEAVATPLVLSENIEASRNRKVYSWYTEAVIDDVIRDLVSTYGYAYEKASRMVFSGGLRIYTLMDPYVQKTIDEVYSDLFFSNGLQSSMVVIDPYTGDVLGLSGGVGKKTANLVLNRATETLRPPGSTIKPLSVYAPALERGIITYGSVYDDIPVDVVGNKIWPQNATRVYTGLTTVNNAVVCSLNTVPVQLVKKLGVRSVYNFLQNKLKISTLIESKQTSNGKVLTDCTLAPLALGQLSYGVTLRELTAAYSIFPSGGYMPESKTYYRVLDSDGNVLLDSNDEKERVIGADTASIMTMMLKNVVDYGTARRITLKNQLAVAGKTGTSGEDCDKWLIAYTPYYLGGVWVGYDSPKKVEKSMDYLTCRLWDRVMKKLHDHLPSKNRRFKLADNVIKVRYCRDSGCLLSAACELDPRGSRAEVGYFTRDTAPKALCTRHRLVEINGETGDLATPDTMPLLKRVVGLLDYRRKLKSIPISDAKYLIENRKTDPGMPIPDPAENLEYEDE
ncbi:MAG: transglycosylase domain-containing protein [Clostridia bacterium]|nr:transglycosylase domain-containing protein [Clostridia bacterium]